MNPDPPTPDHWMLLDLERHPTSGLQEKAAARIRELLREVADLCHYKSEHDKAIEAVMWMHDDDTLDIPLGSRLTVEGVAALRKQRDDLRQQLAHAQAALAPFANLDVQHMVNSKKKLDHPVFGLNGTKFTLGDVLRASQVYAALTAPSGGTTAGRDGGNDK